MRIEYDFFFIFQLLNSFSKQPKSINKNNCCYPWNLLHLWLVLQMTFPLCVTTWVRTKCSCARGTQIMHSSVDRADQQWLDKPWFMFYLWPDEVCPGQLSKGFIRKQVTGSTSASCHSFERSSVPRGLTNLRMIAWYAPVCINLRITISYVETTLNQALNACMLVCTWIYK